MTVTHQSTDDLRNRLRGKLEKLITPDTEVVEGEYVESSFDVDDELGLTDA